jgi:diacylglycerol kinase (ATP)
MNALVLWNPVAGGGRAGALLGAVEAGLAEAGVDVGVHRTGSLDDARATAAEAAGRVDVVVALGGDGTVGACAAGLAEAGAATGGARAALGVVPAGSGNDAAAALGLPTRDPLAAVALLPGLARRPVDVIRAELGAGGRSPGRSGVRRYLEVAATGFDGQVNRLANRLPLRGRPRYVGATLLRLPFSRPARFTIGFGDDQVDTHAWMVTVANGPTYGGGLRIAPAARMDDGLLDVVVVGRISRAGLLQALPTVFDGSHIDNPAVTVHRATGLTVAARPAVPVYADGEALGATPARFTVEPLALHVLATPDAPGLGRPG